MPNGPTPQQEIAITNRGGNLLVSAAAGSGKTRVLVDRLMGYLTDPVDPANVDEFLIITFTQLAAAELRARIAKRLSEYIAENPENRHMQRQFQRIYMAKISTVHAFCSELLREYAYRLDLPADFHMADETDCQEIQEQVMEALLESAYERAETDSDIRGFLDGVGYTRDDRQVPEILLKVYQNARCHLDPHGWLDECVRATQAEELTDASQTIWGKFLIEDLHGYLDELIATFTLCAEQAEAADRMERITQVFKNAVTQYEKLRACDTWDAIVENKEYKYGSLRFRDGVDEDLQARLKAVWNACKEKLANKLSRFSEKSEKILGDLQASGRAVRGLVQLVRDFDKEYEKYKRRRRQLDFGDLEHKTLDLLRGKNRNQLTPEAREISRRFREVMVDEYQDTNGVQDAIFEALTRQRQNCFMVGDVKQAIYQFRLADPGIFLKKYNEYGPVETARPGQGRKVLLSKNFRSSYGVISAVNDVFSRCMSPQVGGLAYTNEEALEEGHSHVSLGEPEVELYALDAGDDAYGREAAFVADRILSLLDGTHFVRQDNELRPIRPDDIVILLRSPKTSGTFFQQALEKRGLRCALDGNTDLLKTQEVAVLRAMLQVIGNPLQDIPLVTVLSSPVFGFTADDLAAFRAGARNTGLYAALKKAGTPKAEAFLEILESLRETARLVGISELLERIFAVTRMDSIFAAMADGQERSAHLQAFCQRAAAYESGEARDLNQFLDYLATLGEDGMKLSQQPGPGTIRILSIHKSKGLEFPVVFLSCLSRRFSTEWKKAEAFCDKELGIGLSGADLKHRIRYPSLAKRAIMVKNELSELSGELRILYVAMTRARDRLIMTYSGNNLESAIPSMVMRMDLCSPAFLNREVGGMGAWVMMAALRRTEAGELFALGEQQPRHRQVSDAPWAIHAVTVQLEEDACTSQETLPARQESNAFEKLAAALSFTYPYMQAVQTPSKQTATQLKGRIKDMESAEYTREQKPISRTWRRPSFAEGTARGKDYGNAIHAVMQYIRYGVCADLSGVERELKRLVAEKFLSPEQAQLVDCKQIAAFFESELGRKLCAGGEVLREFKFSILDDAARYSPGIQNEKVLLQGVVDCALLEEDGITVVDFKTDRVTEDTLEAVAEGYRAQVQIYADALARIYQKKIKGRFLYFFRMGRFVPL